MSITSSELIAGAIGATGAFLFGRLEAALSFWFRNQQQNYYALCRAERTYNLFILQVAHVKASSAALLADPKVENIRILEIPRLAPPEDMLASIHSLDLVNLMADHAAMVTKLNADLTTLANRRSLILNEKDSEQLRQLILPYLATLTVFEPFMAEIQQATVSVLAAIRYLAPRSQPFLIRLYERIHRPWKTKSFSRGIEKETLRLTEELASQARKRREKIDKLVKDISEPSH